MKTEDKTIRVITVRLPAALHARLRDEADRHYISMNQLAIDKLLLPVPRQTLVWNDDEAHHKSP